MIPVCASSLHGWLGVFSLLLGEAGEGGTRGPCGVCEFFFQSKRLSRGGVYMSDRDGQVMFRFTMLGVGRLYITLQNTCVSREGPVIKRRDLPAWTSGASETPSRA